MSHNYKIGVVGLGYVGLPLAVAFGRKFPVIGYDKNIHRIKKLSQFQDDTNEVSKEEIEQSKLLRVTNEILELSKCNIYIICVPTPINKAKVPNLNYLIEASHLVGTILKANDIIIYESTVYPGCTVEICVPNLEAASKLKFNVDFFCGYSPERINPGDKSRRIEDIIKITSGSNLETAKKVDELYKSIIRAGTHLASSIEVAEAAKVIENTQRDVNIALVNEFSLLFSKLNLDTNAILQAASTKWNFLNFKPGLVGGHCIGVDPYYLEHRAKQVGFHTQLISASRRINDAMAEQVSLKLIERLLESSVNLSSAKILVMGVSFKEDCPDIRNSKVFDVISNLEKYVDTVDVYDPVVSNTDVERSNGVVVIEKFCTVKDNLSKNGNLYDAILIAVRHSSFCSIEINTLRQICTPLGLIYDLKGIYPPGLVDISL